MEIKNDISLKITLLGEASVGKTSLINVYYKNKFDENIDATLSASCIQKTLETNNGKYNLKIWDTAGEERFRCLNKIYIKDSNIVILVYDISRKSTFKELSYWIDYANEFLGNENAVFGIVGNKLDLFDKEEEIKKKDPEMEFDVVEHKEGYDFAEDNDAIFCQTSSKEGAPGFSEFVRKLVEKCVLKKKLIKTEKIILNNENIRKEKEEDNCYF